MMEGGMGYSLARDGFIDLIAGTAGGIANVYAGQPLDTVKVKMQAFPQIYGNWMKCFMETFRCDGVHGLYAGTVPALAANIAENAMLFTAYGYCQKAVAVLTGKREVSAMSPIENASAGSLAAVFAATVLCPTELVKCRLQSVHEMNPHIKCTPFSICRDMLRAQGVRSFYHGMTATLLREVPGYFVFFGSYEACRYVFTPPGKTKDDIGVVHVVAFLGMLRTAISGAVGGMTLWTLVFPADVIKSRMQVSGRGGSVTQMFLDIVRKEGISKLYRGLVPTLIRTCSASSCLFIAYENTRYYLNKFL